METTLVFNKEAVQKINRIKKHYGTRSNADIINKALELLFFAIDLEESDGKLFGFKGEKTYDIRV